MDYLPIVDPEHDALAFRAFYLLQTLSISFSGSPHYDDVDVLARCEVLPRYYQLMELLIKNIHPVSGFAGAFNPHSRRAPQAFLNCKTLPEDWLDRLDQKVAGIEECRARTIRPQIAVHPSASPRLLDAMLSRGGPTNELIETIEGALAKMKAMDPHGALERAREETDWG